MVVILLANKKIIGIGFLLFLASAFFTYLLFFQLKTNSKIVSPQAETAPANNEGVHLVANTVTVIPENDVYNILLLGNGDPSHEGASLTDSMMVVHLDIPNKKAVLISLPRDIWIGNQKINFAYLNGRKNGGESTGFTSVRQAVSTVTGLPIHYAILIDFNGFVQAIDNLGGISVNVPKTFDDYYYPITGKELDNCGMSPEQLVSINATMSGFNLEKQYSCRYEHLHFDAGKNQMNGQTAIKFVRSRHSNQDGNDFARGIRQQSVILGIKDKLLSLDALNKIPTFFNQANRLLKTDLNLKTTQAIGDLIVNPKEYKITKIGLSDQNVFVSSTGPGKQYILIPKEGIENWSGVQTYINNQLN